MYDIQKIREDFPILSRTVYDKYHSEAALRSGCDGG